MRVSDAWWEHTLFCKCLFVSYVYVRVEFVIYYLKASGFMMVEQDGRLIDTSGPTWAASQSRDVAHVYRHFVLYYSELQRVNQQKINHYLSSNRYLMFIDQSCHDIRSLISVWYLHKHCRQVDCYWTACCSLTCRPLRQNKNRNKQEQFWRRCINYTILSCVSFLIQYQYLRIIVIVTRRVQTAGQETFWQNKTNLVILSSQHLTFTPARLKSA